jgi:nicotinate-nucleotide adenylyltransferase
MDSGSEAGMTTKANVYLKIMKIGLLGGTFNPPHIGHILIAQQVLDFGAANPERSRVRQPADRGRVERIDEVWFLPNYGQHPPKPGVASVQDRVAMVQMIRLSKTRISTLEIDHKLDGKTINLLPYLPKEHEYRFIIGSDWLPKFSVWGSYKELLKKLPFLVFPRYGHPVEPLYEHMTVVTHPTLVTFDISCTKIRDRVKRGLPIDHFVPSGVAEYIKKHGLYL